MSVHIFSSLVSCVSDKIPIANFSSLRGLILFAASLTIHKEYYSAQKATSDQLLALRFPKFMRNIILGIVLKERNEYHDALEILKPVFEQLEADLNKTKKAGTFDFYAYTSELISQNSPRTRETSWRAKVYENKLAEHATL